MRLKGKVALITGASRGIGAAIARRLSDDGAAVAITYFSSKIAASELVQALASKGKRAVAIEADYGDADSITRAVEQAEKSLGGLDILVNNGAISGQGLISEFSMAELDRIVAVNIKGVFVATQAAIKYMSGGGRIINIGSISSDYMPIGGQSAYAMTKGAIAGLTRGLARELGPSGITVNNVQPGRVATDLLRAAVGPYYDQIPKTIAVQRFGEPEEVAAMVSYLCSEEASYVTGAQLRVDGGTSV
jgi:3-oxoacyl-[acyl-carrier protein] reductase